jgi:hypothetical protein
VSFIQWVSYVGDSDHLLVILELGPTKRKPPSHFKLNLGWLREEDYVNKVKYILMALQGNLLHYNLNTMLKYLNMLLLSGH